MRHSDRLAAKKAAFALALEGRWSHVEMAARVSVSARTIERWLAEPDFRAQLVEARNNLATSLSETVYADKLSRILALAQMAESARREYEQRPLLIERRPTQFGEITNESFNRDAHAAFRDALNDIAKELGERSNNINITATQQSLNVTVLMERMRSDRSIGQRADDLLAQLAGGASPGS